LGHDRVDRQMALLEKIGVIAAEILGADLIESATEVSMERLDGAEIAIVGGCGVVSTDQFFVQTLQQLGHRTPPCDARYAYALRITRLPVGRRASGFVLVA
jgi:hypothetical protein